MKGVIGRGWLWILVWIAVCISGCGTFSGAGEGSRVDAPVTRTVVDVQGQSVKLREKPQRIVSCSISTDEILLEMVDASRIAALSVLVDDPGISNLAAAASGIGTRVDLHSVEPILAVQPDLILVPDFVKPEIIQSLRDLSVPVFVYRTPKTVEEVKCVIKQFAYVTGEEVRGQAMVAEMDRRLAAVTEKVGQIPVAERKRVILIRANGAYFSPKNSISDICRLAGVEDATQELAYGQPMPIPQEAIVRLNPDIFFVPNWNYDGRHDPDLLIRSIVENPSYQTTNAVRRGEVKKLHGSYILSLSQYIVDAVEEVARLSYPEMFSP